MRVLCTWILICSALTAPCAANRWPLLSVHTPMQPLTRAADIQID